MLQIALAGLYVTLLCWTWGHLTIRILQSAVPGGPAPMPAFSIVCIAGLSTLAVIAGALSIWMPVGGWMLQTALLLVALSYWLMRKSVGREFFTVMRKAATRMHPVALCLLLSCSLLLLLMGTWVISHPDTLGYHVQTIRWMAEYKAIPGLVHLHSRYGYQGYWFLVCALFSFPFTHTAALTFINTCVAGWYVLFMVGRIGVAWKGGSADNAGNKLQSILFLLLLAYSLWDFGLLRLTAVSASPDFVAGIYCWLVFYLLVNRKQQNEWMLIFFFSILAVLIKLSSAPLLLLAVVILYRFLKTGSRKAIVVLCLFAILAISPFITRNVIATGHFLFPSTFADILQVDWKLDHSSTQRAQQYITDYARIGEKANVAHLPPLQWKDWLPVWWNNRNGAERCALATLLTALLLACFFFKKIIQRAPFETRLLFFISAAGLVFWFLQAPDPRFGYGFIFPIQGMVLYRLATTHSIQVPAAKRLLLLAAAAIILWITGYTVYRFIYFFHARNWIMPEGVLPIATRKVSQQGVVFQVPCRTCGCGDAPLPCAFEGKPFQLRGSSVTDGFRSAQRVKADR